MTAVLADPRTELVHQAADEVDHIYCGDCGSPDLPMLCGKRDTSEDCPEGCGHPTCPMCVVEWDRHSCPRLPWWRRWFA